MKVVVAGKGGSGKTTVAGLLARLLARSGREVVALDADTNPMLGISLGIEPELVDGLVSARQALAAGELEHQPTAREIVATFGADAPDGVRLVVVSRIDQADPG